MARILWHSVAPWAASAYGAQSAQVVRSLRADGHDVVYTACGGISDGPVRWEGIEVYPAPGGTPGSLSTWLAGGTAFEGLDVAITFLDAFRLEHEPLGPPTLGWTPVQDRPLDPDTHAHFSRSGARPVACSQHGRLAFHEAGWSETPLVPCSVDTAVYRPLVAGDRSASRDRACRRFGLDPAKFWIGIVASNVQPLANRKSWPEALLGVAALAEERDDVGLFLHTDLTGTWHGGQDLHPLLEATVGDRVDLAATDPVAYRAGLPASEMAALYNAFDVLVAPSASEGFCVPLIEAQACGVPVVASRFSAQTENVGVGWLVDGQERWFPPERSTWFTPSVASITEGLRWAAERRADDGAAGEAVAFAARFDHARTYAERWRPLLAATVG